MSAPPPGSRVLVVDDDERLRTRLAASFERRGYPAHPASGHAEALALAERFRPDMAVIDLKMPGGSGLQVLAELRQLLPDLRAVMLTGYGSIPTAVEAVHLGALDFIAKPADTDMLLAALARDPGKAPRDAGYEPPSLARAEWEHIQRVLEDCGGNITRAAELLGLHRRTLQRKLQKYPPRK